MVIIMQSLDFALKENTNEWLRHPTLGDPSFDSFVKRGQTVHHSQPPYEWAVNGSLFRDPADGAWYLYAGIYAYSYVIRNDSPSDFLIYRSRDEGATWDCLGTAFEKGFCFDGYPSAADHHPDAVVTYDEDTGRYWLAYDWSLNSAQWENVFANTDIASDSGSALAWAMSPAGPFTRLASPLYSNLADHDKIGRFMRGYATTMLKRESDWIALILCDSREYHSWGLVGKTAPAPEGPWSDPIVLLSVDGPGYYPAPVEFHPCFAHDGTVYAPATSVAMNRNYQAVFAAPLEQAHMPAAWSLDSDGNVWHARRLADEKYGIWGQAFHGFVWDGEFHVMYPSKDGREFGTISVATRPWDQPYSDGFTLSGHQGKSITATLKAYADFVLEAVFTLAGTAEFAFGYEGILGADVATANAQPSAEALSGYHALRVTEQGTFSLLTVDRDGRETVHCEGVCGERVIHMQLQRTEETVRLCLNGGIEKTVSIGEGAAAPLAIIAHEFSVLDCNRFEVTGQPAPCRLAFQANDALLGVGQKSADWRKAAGEGYDCRSRCAAVGRGSDTKNIGKWNVQCREFTLFAPKAPGLGSLIVSVDGRELATVDLSAQTAVPSAAVYTCAGLQPGRHGIELRPEKPGDLFVLDVLEALV